MKTIDLLAGTKIDHAAAMLVANAPARARFCGIDIRARYATTNPRDIVNRYEMLMGLRAHAWRESSEGKRVAAEQEAKWRECQRTADSLMRGLSRLGFCSPAAVLAWLEAMAEPTSDRNVSVNRIAIRAAFTANGWPRDTNTGDAFNGEDARNVAGWIVGQWLDTFRGSTTLRFIAEWRAKFSTEVPS